MIKTVTIDRLAVAAAFVLLAACEPNLPSDQGSSLSRPVRPPRNSPACYPAGCQTRRGSNSLPVRFHGDSKRIQVRTSVGTAYASRETYARVSWLLQVVPHCYRVSSHSTDRPGPLISRIGLYFGNYAGKHQRPCGWTRNSGFSLNSDAISWGTRLLTFRAHSAWLRAEAACACPRGCGRLSLSGFSRTNGAS